MRKKPLRPHLCSPNARKVLIAQLVKKIRENLGDNEIRTFAEICEAMPLLTLQLNKSDLGELSDLQKHETIDYLLYL